MAAAGRNPAVVAWDSPAWDKAAWALVGSPAAGSPGTAVATTSRVRPGTEAREARESREREREARHVESPLAADTSHCHVTSHAVRRRPRVRPA